MHMGFPAALVGGRAFCLASPMRPPVALKARQRAMRAGLKVLDLCASPGSKTLQAMDAGGQPQEIDRVALPAFRDWAGYDTRHGFNVLRAWRELEPVWMDQAKPTR